jgi:membrane protein DedA with SNARE-associated domain
VPFARYNVLTLAGSAIWCFTLAGVGWALGSRWEDFHHTFRFVDYVIVAALAAGVAALAWKLLRRRSGSPSGAR